MASHPPHETAWSSWASRNRSSCHSFNLYKTQPSNQTNGESHMKRTDRSEVRRPWLWIVLGLLIIIGLILISVLWMRQDPYVAPTVPPAGIYSPGAIPPLEPTSDTATEGSSLSQDSTPKGE